MKTFKDCMRKISPFNGGDDARINQIWEIPNIEKKFEDSLLNHPKWTKLIEKNRPQYAVIEAEMNMNLKLFSLAIFKNGNEEIPVIVLILVK